MYRFKSHVSIKILVDHLNITIVTVYTLQSETENIVSMNNQNLNYRISEWIKTCFVVINRTAFELRLNESANPCIQIRFTSKRKWCDHGVHLLLELESISLFSAQWIMFIFKEKEGAIWLRRFNPGTSPWPTPPSLPGRPPAREAPVFSVFIQKIVIMLVVMMAVTLV